MSFAKVYSAQTSLLSAHIVTIEVDISRGLNAFSIVGLPDKAVEESKDRISAAIKNTNFASPKSKNQKIIISLAPAALKKEGPLFDLGMSLAYLRASGDIDFEPEGKLFLGELSLDGELKPVHGALALVKEAKKEGFQEVFVPEQNAKEAGLIRDITIYSCKTLEQVVKHVDETGESNTLISPQKETQIEYEELQNNVSFEDIKGQSSAKRGLEIAAAGGHNIVLFGPPGTGKTMLARAFTGILPHLEFEEILETTAIHSIAGTLRETLLTHPPYRSPHHTASHVSIVGGGAIPKPGEVTLAHRGVLFLDEFPEFDRRVIDSLRQPLEDRCVNITRAKGTATFPANFILVAAMNPCPCGNFGSQKECVCTLTARERYQKKISGPIIDRVDMWIEVPHVDIELLQTKRKEYSETNEVKERIKQARNVQTKRFGKMMSNSSMSARDIEKKIDLDEKVREVLNGAAKQLDLSPRAYHRTIKLARTIADLAQKEKIEESHILEALQYRPKQAN